MEKRPVKSLGNRKTLLFDNPFPDLEELCYQLNTTPCYSEARKERGAGYAGGPLRRQFVG